MDIAQGHADPPRRLHHFADLAVELQTFAERGFANGQHYDNRELALIAADAFRDMLLTHGWTAAIDDTTKSAS